MYMGIENFRGSKVRYKNYTAFVFKCWHLSIHELMKLIPGSVSVDDVQKKIQKSPRMDGWMHACIHACVYGCMHVCKIV